MSKLMDLLKDDQREALAANRRAQLKYRADSSAGQIKSLTKRLADLDRQLREFDKALRIVQRLDGSRSDRTVALLKEDRADVVRLRNSIQQDIDREREAGASASRSLATLRVSA